MLKISARDMTTFERIANIRSRNSSLLHAFDAVPANPDGPGPLNFTN